jgi:hypothetical protein
MRDVPICTCVKLYIPYGVPRMQGLVRPELSTPYVAW